MQSRYWLKDIIYYIERFLYNDRIPEFIVKSLKTEGKTRMTIELVESPENIWSTDWALKVDSPRFVHNASIFLPDTTDTKVFFKDDLIMISDYYDQAELKDWFRDRLLYMINKNDKLSAKIKKDKDKITIKMG